MNNISGFYKYKNESTLYGPNQITGPNFDLLREEHDNYTYPVDGRYWFDNRITME
jgi:hypothetical protein